MTNIGHMHIKQRRLSRRVPAAAGGMLGDYVPFNFCPRSVMLFRVNKGHQDYPGGQEEVIHLVSTVQTAIATGQPWAFTDRHAELLATTHWVMAHNDGTPEDVEVAIKAVHGWSSRKASSMKPAQIRAAWTRLREQGWV